MTTRTILAIALRAFVLAFAITALSMVLFTLAANAATVAQPKDVAVVTGDTLKAGDIFTGLTPDQADYTLGTPPQPGQDMTLDAHILQKIADAIDLDWHPSSPAIKTTVRRAATIVDDKDIDAALDKGLREEGVDGKFNIQLSQVAAPMIALPPDQPQTVAVKTLRFDAAHDSFEAILVSPSAENPVKQLALTGRVQRMTSIPVLKTSMRHGDLIGADDIQMTDIPNDDVQNGMFLKPEQLIGLTPQRIVESGKPLRDGDLQHPQVLSRGDFVTLIYADGPLMLTAKGRAMENAASGDLVHVINLASEKSLQGVATGDHEVTISQ